MGRSLKVDLKTSNVHEVEVVRFIPCRPAFFLAVKYLQRSILCENIFTELNFLFVFPYRDSSFRNITKGSSRISKLVPGSFRPQHRRKIRLIEGNAKCPLKNLTCKGTVRQVFICLRPLPSYDPISPPCILHTCIQYTYSHRDRGES